MLQLYMLQLVQALKYEDLAEFEAYADRMLPEETVDVIQSIGDHEQLESMSQSALSGNFIGTNSVFIRFLKTPPFNQSSLDAFQSHIAQRYRANGTRYNVCIGYIYRSNV